MGTWFAALRLAPATVVTSVLVAGRADHRPCSMRSSTARIPEPLPLAGYGLVTLAAVVLVGRHVPCATPGTPHRQYVSRPGSDAASSGPILFARYAFGPNRLGYCGPDDAAELFGEADARRRPARAAPARAEQFEGAYPYLAADRPRERASPIRSTRASSRPTGWATACSAMSRLSRLGDSLDTRFRRRLRGDGWQLAGRQAHDGALPVHAFHVLDVFPRLGLMRGGAPTTC